MKKLKALKGALIGVFVVAAACCVFAACSSDNEKEEATDTSPITEMTLSVDNAKRTYLTYQSFSSEGIEATVTRESGETEDVVANDLVVDYSQFNNTEAGEYDIYVSYTEDGVTLSDSYKVEVIEEIVGMTIEKDEVDYYLWFEENEDENGNESECAPSGATIDLSDMKVYSVDAGGVATSEMSDGAYELAFYKGGDRIDSLADLSVGIYTIYAFREVTVSGKYSTIDYECGAYVLCYVIDSLDTIEFVQGTTTQEMSVTDEMTGTWTYLLTYKSGIQRSLKANDVAVTGVNTLSGTDTGDQGGGSYATATATYTETIASSTEHKVETVSTTVDYQITTPEGKVVFGYSLDFEALKSISGFTSGNLSLKAEWFVGTNSFLSYIGNDGNNDRLRDQSTICIEVKGEALSVTFMGTGSIKIGFRSTGSGNWSNIGLKNEDGYYLKASYMPELNESFNEHGLEGNAGYSYEVRDSSSEVIIEYTVTEPGTYIIATNIQDFSDTMGSINRPTRITSIEMTDIYSSSSSGDSGIELTASTTPNEEMLPLAETLCMGGIYLALPQSFVAMYGESNSKKN